MPIVTGSRFASLDVLLLNCYRPMVIAVIAVGMMQHSLIEIILMISVRNDLVPTALVSAGTGDGSARGRILCVYLEHMLIVVPLV